MSFPWRSLVPVVLALLLSAAPARADAPLLHDDFSQSPGPNRVLTNEYAYWNPEDPLAVPSAIWEMDSGTLFSRDGTGWTGAPDVCRRAEPHSTSCNNSAVFRLATRRRDFGDVRVELALRSNGLVSTDSTPAVDWDGVHVWLRYQSERSLYYASVNRRDDRVVIKKKCEGGPSNDGTYYTLGREVTGQGWPVGAWQHVAATVQTNADGSVTIGVEREGRLVHEATDTGVGCPPIAGPGGTGVRADNDDIQIDDFTVRALDAEAGPAVEPEPSPVPAPAAPVTPVTAPAAAAPIPTENAPAASGAGADASTTLPVTTRPARGPRVRARAARPWRRYTADVRYRATARVRLVAEWRTRSGRWRRLARSRPLRRAPTARRARWTTPPAPARARRIRVRVTTLRSGARLRVHALRLAVSAGSRPRS